VPLKIPAWPCRFVAITHTLDTYSRGSKAAVIHGRPACPGNKSAGSDLGLNEP
jgi:hypothetical protein